MSRKNWTNEQIFNRLVKVKTDTAYWANILELRKRPTQKTFAYCSQLLTAEEPKKRRIALDILAQLGSLPRPFYKETIELLFKQLKLETQESVIQSALHAVGHNNQVITDAQTAILVKFNEHKSPQIRYSLVFALLGVENQMAINTMISLSTEPDTETRDWATFGLGTQISTHSKQITVALWARINDKNKLVRLEALMGLAKRKDPGIHKVIIQDLINEKYDTLLFEAIEELQHIDFLHQLRLNLNDPKLNLSAEWKTEIENCIKKLESL